MSAPDTVHVAHPANRTNAKPGKSRPEIGRVIQVITTIAQQTDLLALNAALEAACAGEAAREVKEPAEATEEIIGVILHRIHEIFNSIGPAPSTSAESA